MRHRLLAVLAADVAGYSRLMALDDQATVAALDAGRAVFREQIATHGGRVVDMAGDSVMSVFETAGGALRAALAVQQQLHDAASSMQAERQLRFRIGIHVGDVIEKPDGTVYGDGVNVAARLESLAEPGAVAISQAVHGMVVGRVAAEFEDIGEQAVKNIAQRVRTFRVRLPVYQASVDANRVSLDGGRVQVYKAARQLLIGGQPVRLGRRAFDLLLSLLERRERVVPKQELLDVVWPGLVVQANNLQVHVMTLRRLLGAHAITTVSGRGYRLALRADPVAAAPAVVRAPVKVSAVSPDSLIGREQLIGRLCSQLTHADTRLVTLTGPGGAGKTRLALHVAAQLAPSMADGACVVLLAPVRAARDVMSAVVHALKLQEGDAASLLTLVQGFLRLRQMLLVLDNLEHLPQIGAEVAALLEACPRLKVLTTSRVLLHLGPEREFKVPPLALPDEASDAKDLAAAPAVALFVARATSFGRDVRASPADLEAAAQICRRLDGLPLAIELAAARLRTLTPVALAARLQHSLPLLRGGPADAPQRQQTLRDTIAWSHDLLEAPARVLFRRLGVFAGGWSIEAAEALADDGTALDALEELLDHNIAQRTDDIAGQPRYTMLETIREYALEQLGAAGETELARHKHAAFFIALAAQGAPQLTSAGRLPWLLRLRAEMNNFRLALAWLVRERPDADGALALAAALTWLWYFDGLYREGLGWMGEAMQVPGAQAQTPAAAAVLSGMARLASFSGEMARAQEWAVRSIERWRALDDRRGLGFALFHLGVPALFHQGRAAAVAALQEARQCFREVDDPWGVALATVYEGVVLSYRPGSEEEAMVALNAGLALTRSQGDEWAASTCSSYIGSLAFRRGDYATARRGFTHILTQARETGDRFRLSRSTHLMGELELVEGHHGEALQQLAEALALAQEQGRAADLPQLLRSMARALAGLGHSAEAATLFGAGARRDGPRSTLPLEDGIAIAAAQAACRAALGESLFDSQAQAGAALPLERAAEQAQAWSKAFRPGAA